MSNKRITDLTELTNPTTDDVLPIVDIATNTTQKVQVGNLPTTTAVTNALATKQDTLVSGTNIKTLNSTSLLGSGNIVLTANPSGVSGAIQFSNGSAFASDAANFFWDDTNNRLGIGTNAPTQTLDVNGSAIFSSSVISLGSFRTHIVQANNNDSNGRVALQTWDNMIVNVEDGGVGIAKGVYLTPSAQVHIKGNGSTSATTSLLVQNSAGTTLMSIADNGAISIGANNITTFSGTMVNPVGPIQALNFANGGNPFNFGTASVYAISGTTPVVTSGQRDGFLGEFTFAPTSGTAILNVLNASPTINQTGGANGITRGLYINPTLTAAADFRAIEATSGNVLIGNSASNTAKLSIKGSGSTSATTSLLVQNSAGTELFRVRDDQQTIMRGTVTLLGLFNNDYISIGLNRIYGMSIGQGALSFNANNISYSDTGSVAGITSSCFNIDSTTRGFLPPRMTTTQKNAIATPAAGLVVYDSTTNKLCCYDGSTWNDLF